MLPSKENSSIQIDVDVKDSAVSPELFSTTENLRHSGDSGGTTTSGNNPNVIRPPRANKWYSRLSFNYILDSSVQLVKRLTAFPMVTSPGIYFGHDDRFDPSGNMKAEPANDDDPEMYPSGEKVEIEVNYEKATKALFEGIIKLRKEAKSAKDNYHTMKVDLSAFPEWKEAHVDRLRSIFQIFDISGDGLVDFEEFGVILEEYGDNTPAEARRRYFDAYDDGTGSIDFLYFLKMVHSLVTQTPAGMEELAKSFLSIDRNMARIRSLDVVQQLQAGLF